jgi:hypothetical protein
VLFDFLIGINVSEIDQHGARHALLDLFKIKRTELIRTFSQAAACLCLKLPSRKVPGFADRHGLVQLQNVAVHRPLALAPLPAFWATNLVGSKTALL